MKDQHALSILLKCDQMFMCGFEIFIFQIHKTKETKLQCKLFTKFSTTFLNGRKSNLTILPCHSYTILNTNMGFTNIISLEVVPLKPVNNIQ